MSKKYLVWKDPNCNGIDPEWIEMKGKEFAKFIKLPQNKKRCFIRLLNDVCMDADTILIESTKSEYVEWRKEYDHRTYLFEHSVGYEQVSLDYPCGDIDHHELHEIVADESVNVERDFFCTIENEVLVKCLDLLTNLEKEALIMAFWNMPNKTDKEISAKLKIERSAFCKRKNRAINKINFFFKL